MTRAPKTWKAWTTGELARLEEFRLDGLTAAEIARRLGRTPPAVKCRLAALGVSKPAAANRWLRELVRPHTISGLAARLGVTKWAVKQAKRKLRRAGFDIPAARREEAIFG